MIAHGSQSYLGRFAPSPTGPLHFGSLVAALASYVDAKHHHGSWLLRIEDVDTERCSRAHETIILDQLAAYGLKHDAEMTRQSDRSTHYRKALATLEKKGLTYRCLCTRKRLTDAPRNQVGEIIYPGTCRSANIANSIKHKSIRFNVTALGEQQCVEFTDRVMGVVRQSLASDVGDFVILRADGDFAYQLAVVVDDAIQGITHVVRGADLLHNTPRQIALQRALGYPQPAYLHVPIARNERGEKLSKQSGAKPISTEAHEVLENLELAWRFLAQTPVEGASSAVQFLAKAIPLWQPQRVIALKNSEFAPKSIMER